MGLMMLAAAPGALIQLAATGPEAEAAVAALAKLVECKFDED
jgi:phosphocarrier protein